MTEAEARREFAAEVVRRLRRAGHEALWAGGCVRDIILGGEPADYDVATDARPEAVMEMLPFPSIPVGIAFGVVRVRHPRIRGIEVEIATFRSDEAYVDGRRPKGVIFSTPELDAARRDFTINGLFMDPETGRVIDHVGGLADLRGGLLRAIGDPAERFREDKLRLLRAVRFAARFDLHVEPATLAAIRSMASEVLTVSPERIAQELRKMLVHPSRDRAMDLALDVGLIGVIFPPLAEMRGLFQGKPVQPEGDLWDHAMLVLRLLGPRPSFPLAFAAFVHDVGKPSTRSRHHGRTSFHSHDLAGAKIAERFCRLLRLSNAERERITWLVAYHQYLGEAKKLRESKLKRILAEPGIDELLALHRADALASTGITEQVDYCVYYLEHQPSGPINPAPLLTGHDLARLGLEPGPGFKSILDTVREAQLEGRVQNKREATEWVEHFRATGRWPAVWHADALDDAVSPPVDGAGRQS
ncbi:tRNA nucleotidyltransferase/poly(A) polymerase [Aquisphaera giovannonii]|uniref:tRNA nucleotidyltransferase/poly(A) polymerase n=1 Tax=Aquisphaera giovannonii TaxID=406548 RepID=A0A5B9VZ75_9BACT|nr:CCA tRNA nucleotidyltransferase [Aquisphaera giovannonii]QEH33281.1 tRNA nucleotidyltransferase/poly(A) polymerase [Aquisphaera giovannonii]